MGSFKKAVKSQAKARIAMFGPSGSGKTFTSLSVATGLGNRIAVMDSENRTAIKYADRFTFDVVELEKKTVAEYVQYIKEAGESGYDVLIIDSLTHAWQVLNEDVQKIADTSFSGNFWSAWSKGTPMQRELIDAILNYPGHIIATMRSKTEWQSGSNKPTRVGLAPEQGKGIEFEFDILFEINTTHLANIIKDRSGKFQDMIIDRPGKKFGQEIAGWLSDGAPVIVSVDDQVKALKLEFGKIVNSKDDDGKYYFSEEERAKGKEDLVALIPATPEERKVRLTAMLEERKQILQDKIAGEIDDPPPAIQDEPAATLTTTPTTPAEQETPAPPQEAPVQPAAESVTTTPSSPPEEADDGFQDDIPYENPGEKPNQDELQIF